jgi:uncharacterized MAPEG superfamily protein
MRLSVADWSLLGAVLAYMAPIAIAKYGALKSFDNSNPRDEVFFQDPLRRRALWAHQNGMEGFAFFAAAVIVAQMRGAPQARVDVLAVAYVALRVAFVVFYLTDRPRLRSTAWSLGFAANVAILLSPLGA